APAPPEIYTDSGDLHAVNEGLKSQGIQVSSMEMIMAPKNEMALNIKNSVQILKLIDDLEELDDVRRVYSNLEVTDEAVMAFEAAM
ncbi:MAG: YebC/PmpR family DNA-binding transcriptional regulator, partial [Chloroflexota bacterium]|nr:YebC/PmpR family DNA-binding transcriptional regulator [Chloroflexota bacterium]